MNMGVNTTIYHSNNAKNIYLLFPHEAVENHTEEFVYLTINMWALWVVLAKLPLRSRKYMFLKRKQSN